MRASGTWLALPKPSRVTGWVAARAHAPRIGAADAERVMARFGARLIGRPTNLSLTWRNRLVVVRTSAGRKVLKQYRETSTLEAIAHEHSIIDHLEERRFPSTRLDHTPTGESIVEVDGHWYASFDYESGRHVAATLLSSARRQALTTEAGRTMARLHRELLGFRPAGRHHLSHGLDVADGERDLAWHLRALDRLCSEAPVPGDESAERDLRWLRQRADHLRREVVEAARRVEEAQLPRRLIHGDYGTHNLLFRRDGTAVVHDFELARYDWRLLDLVIACLRLPPDLQDALIAGYRESGDLPSPELQLLPWLWRYHLLSGVIRSWQVYGELGGRARLTTARVRLVRADAGPGLVLTRWQ